MRNWYGVSSHDGVTVYGAVEYNYIYKSTDGGETWTALTSAGSRNWRGVSSHDGVTVYGAVWGNYIHKIIPILYNGTTYIPYTIIIQQSTNFNYSITDTMFSSLNLYIYYMLKTAENTWSIYKPQQPYNRWEPVVTKIGSEWYYRDTNNTMIVSNTNEIDTISMAIANNSFNRQEGRIYNTHMNYNGIMQGPITFSATFYNFNTNGLSPPMLQNITTRSTITSTNYQLNSSEYTVHSNKTNNEVRKHTRETTDVIIEYTKQVKD